MNPLVVGHLTERLGRWFGKAAPENGRKALTAMVHSGSGFSLFTAGGALLPATQFDHAKEVGDGLGSSVLAAPLNWVMRNFIQAVPIVERLDAAEWKPVSDHGLTNLLRHPNDFYGPRILWMATVLDFSFGNAYWLKIRNTTGQVVQLWWVPAVSMFPRWPTDGKTFIGWYDYQSSQGTVKLDVRDVVHFRFGLDPRNHRMGLSQLGALMREVFTDDQAANFMGAVLRNLGVIGIAVSPKENQKIDAEDIKALKGFLDENFTGDKRGKTFISSLPIDVELLQYNLQGFDISPIRDVSEERVCLHPQTGIITKRGILPITNLQIGDDVITHRGRWRKVLRVTKTPVYEPMVEVRSDGLEPLRATVSHRVLAAIYKPRRDYQLVYHGHDWVQVDALRIASRSSRRIRHHMTIPVLRDDDAADLLELREYIEPRRFRLREEAGSLIHPSPRVQAIAARPRLDAAFGRLLGFYLAEGSSVDNRVYWYFHEQEREYQESVQRDLRAVFGAKSTIVPIPKHHVRAVVVQQAGLARLFNLGTAHTKRLPTWAWQGGLDFRRALWGSWVQGDGSVTDSGHVRVTTMSRDLAWHMRLIAISCGYGAAIGVTPPRSGMIQGRRVAHRGPIYTVRCSPLSITKQRKYRVELDVWTSAIRKVLPFAYSGPVYNLGIEDDESYLTTGGMVHNCAAMGLPASVVGFGTGLHQTKVGATMKENRRMAWTDCIIPNQQIISDELERSLLPEFGASGTERVRFDTTDVPALWEDQNEKHDRVRADFLASMITRGEARRETGRPADASHDVYVQPVNLIQLGSQTRVDTPPTPSEDD